MAMTAQSATVSPDGQESRCMERYYNYEAVVREVAAALDHALGRHNLEVFHPLAVCAILEVMSSPLKAQISASVQMRKVGVKGVEIYLASRLPQEVEALKSPHSTTVNPMMDSVALALARKGTIPRERLFRETLKVHLDLSGRPKSEIDEAMRKHAPLEHALTSAMEYLSEGGVIEPTDDGTAWQLVPGLAEV